MTEGRDDLPTTTPGSPEAITERKSRRTWLRRLSLSLIPPLFLIGGLELSLRVIGLGAPASMYVPGEGETWVTNIPEFGRSLPTRDELNPAEQSFARDKKAGRKRLFMIGGSTVFGAGTYPHHSLPLWVETRLREVLPGQELEVINAGIPGIDSRNLIRVASEVLDYDPDAVILYTGHNELLAPNLYALRQPLSWWLREQKSRFHLLGLLTELLVGEPERFSVPAPNPAGEGPVFDEPAVRLAERGEAVEAYGEHLSTIAALCRDEGVPLLLCTTVCRADYPPVQAYFSKDLDDRDRDEYRAKTKEASLAVEAQEWPRAKELLEGLMALDDRVSLVHYLLGKCALAASNLSEARDYFRAAIEFDGRPNRASSLFVNRVRSVAEDGGWPLADIARTMDRDDVLLDGELFVDFVHPGPRGQCVMAGEIVRALAESEILWSKDSFQFEGEPSVEDYLARKPMASDAMAHMHSRQSLGNLRKWLLGGAIGEELYMAKASAAKAWELDSGQARYLGLLGLIECLSGEIEEGQAKLLRAEAMEPKGLADLAELMARVPDLQRRLQGAGLRSTGEAFVPVDDRP